MRPSLERALAITLLSLAVLANAAALWPETAISRVDLNDNVFHYTLIERIVQAVQAGESPLDCWSAEWSFGFPVIRTYQPLSHLLVAGIYFALGKSVSLMTVFVWARFLSVVLLPLTFFVAARGLRLPPLTAAAASILAPCISTNFLYGVEFGSYTWAGSGLFPQAVATHFLLLSLGFGYRAIREGRRVILAGVLVGLTLLCHMIYGHMAALSLALLAVLPAESSRGIRVRRLLTMGAAAFAISAFQLLPLLRDTPLINHSRWEAVWKWDSFGAWLALSRLFRGELLDHGRLPVLTVLALGGAAIVVWKQVRTRGEGSYTFLVSGAALWILMYFGRPFWGPLLTALGVSEDMHLHRVIGGAQIFLTLLAGVALAEVWRELSCRWHYAAAIVLSGLLLYPMVRDRAQNLANNAIWGRHNLDMYAAERQDLEAAVAKAKDRGGRTYAGLAATWGGTFKVGDVPFYAFLSEAQVPALSFLYHSMALTGDIMVRFNDTSAAQYRLFDIRTVVAPAGLLQFPPGLLTPRERFGRFQIFEAPGGGSFDLVDAVAAVKTTRRNFYDINDRWLQSDWPAKRTHLLLDWRGSVTPGTPRIPEDSPFPVLVSAAPSAGEIAGEQRNGDRYQADFTVLRPAYALFKMTWHPNWKAYVDGTERPAIMLSPGFPAVLLGPGSHHVEFRYAPGPFKPVMAVAGLLVVGLMSMGKRWSALASARRRTEAWFARFAERWNGMAQRLPEIDGLLALSLPICIPLFTSSIIWGHDAFCYFPRLIEVHQNIVNGIVLPRWAPDLGHGYGQPLFVFHPPVFSWVAELWYLAGWDAVTAVNLACAVLVVAAAFAMFHLGRLYFGGIGGWLAAAAYLYAPYFAVDLFVRSALEEFAAFPLFPLALYGFGAFARGGRRRYLALGTLAYAALLFCHFPLALVFTPILLGFLALTAWSARSWRMLAAQFAGFAIGLGIGAGAWLPALAEKQDVAMERVLHGAWEYGMHLVYVQQLLSTAWGYGFSVAGPNDGMSFSLGWGHVLIAVTAWIWISRRPKLAERSQIRYFAAAGIVLCGLMLQDAVWFWDHLPLLPYVLFPWRLLGIVTVCIAMLAGALGPAIASLRRGRGWALTGAMALLIVPNLSHLRAGRTAEVDLAFWGPRDLAIRGIETTTMGEVTPRWMPAVPPYNSKAAWVADGDAQLRDVERTPFSWVGEVTGKGASRVRLSTAYFPGWSARIDGRPGEIAPGAGTGLIDVAVPAGEHRVEVSFGRSSARRLGEGISLAAIVLGVTLFRRMRDRAAQEDRAPADQTLEV